MTTLQSIQRDVEHLKSRGGGRDVVIEAPLLFIPTQPHGIYRHQRYNVTTHEYSAVPETEELQQLTQWYHERVPAHAKCDHGGYSWATLEEFLESNRCHCGHWGHE